MTLTEQFVALCFRVPGVLSNRRQFVSCFRSFTSTYHPPIQSIDRVLPTMFPCEVSAWNPHSITCVYVVDYISADMW
jgi:hypothetical protein